MEIGQSAHEPNVSLALFQAEQYRVGISVIID